MKAVRFRGGRATVVEVPEPGGPGVPVRVASAGICGSDLHMLEWELPVVAGHELAGTTPDGRHVAVEPITPCDACPACLAGAYNHCSQAGSVILGVGRDGGMAETCVVPESALVPLAAGVAPADACLVEPLAVAVHGMRRGGIRAGAVVAVVGAGSIGLSALVAARAVGAQVEVEARHDHQAAAAERLGAHHVGAVGTLPEGRYDAVVEAAGSEDAFSRAAALARAGGRIVLLGTYWSGRVAFPGFALGMKEVDVVPSSMYNRATGNRDIDAAAELLARQPEIASTMITHRFPLDAAPEAFATARDRSAGAIKVVMEP